MGSALSKGNQSIVSRVNFQGLSTPAAIISLAAFSPPAPMVYGGIWNILIKELNIAIHNGR